MLCFVELHQPRFVVHAPQNEATQSCDSGQRSIGEVGGHLSTAQGDAAFAESCALGFVDSERVCEGQWDLGPR